MKTKALTLIATMALTILGVHSQEIATWAGFTKAAVTWTFDDGANESSAHSWAAGELEKYGFPGTFYLVTNWTSGRYSTYSGMVSKGHEIGSHTDSHNSTDGELASSQNTINQNIPGQKCLTIAYPNCNVPTESTVLRYYIGGRICGGQNNPKSPSNFARLDSHICGSSGKNSTGEFQSTCQNAAGNNGWAVFLIHGFSQRQANGSYSPTSESAFTGTLSWLDQNRSTYWVATFRDAIKYIKERDNATIKETSSTASEITYSLTDNLDNDIYDYPLSIRVSIPDGWDEGAVAFQNDEEIPVKIEGNYIYFDAVPDGGTILLKSLGSVVPDPEFNFTSPTEKSSWCIDSAYTISWTMSGEASAEYTLTWGEESDETISIKSATASSEWGETEDNPYWTVDKILTDDGAHGENSRWGSMGGTNEWVELNLGTAQSVGGIIIDEFTSYGIVSSFEIQYDDNGSWKTAYTGTSIGNDFSATFAPFKSSKVRLYIKECGDGANINYIALKGTSAVTLKEGITGSGSLTWKPEVSGSGSMAIRKKSGKALGTSEVVTVADCNPEGSGSQEPSNPGTPEPPTTPGTPSECYNGGGYTGPSCDVEGTGAYHTGVYRNLFAEYLGKTEEDIDEKLNSIWNHFFGGGSNTVYYETNDNMAYIFDTGNLDVRTEGMSYGMMICVQLDKQAEFDKIWRWAEKYMQYKEGNEREGLFAWQCETNGTIKGNSCAPDGEAYFLTALWFASHRWGNDGDINYEEEAQYLIKEILDKPNRQAGVVSPIFNMDNYLITFGETSYAFTDPSYNLPGFLELWARWTNTNKEFWAKTAEASRNLLYNSSHSTTGLFPDYSSFDGAPYKPDWVTYESDYYKYDAIRCAMNVGMDYHWFNYDDRQTSMMTKLLTFFKNNGYENGYFTVSGSPQGGTYSEGMAGANGVGAFALTDESLAKEYVQKLWNTNPPSGQWRYYNGMVYFLSMLNASGRFKIWKPAPETDEITLEGETSVTFDGEEYTESTEFCKVIDCVHTKVNIIVANGTAVEDVKGEGIQIYPSPAETEIIVKSNQAIKSIKVIDMRGITLIETTDTTVAVNSIQAGQYIISIELSDGTIINEKLIKK